jgi:hypothetical protein
VVLVVPAAPHVLGVVDGLKVLRIDARSVEAEMIDL